jgi:pimeloyl-ACP methyl ester carboxylesterase
MSSTKPNPTVLFVIGSWHSPAHYDVVRDIFSKAGYETSCPALPSLGQFPPIGLTEDAERIREELKTLVEKEEKEVIVVAHSYGGMVSTEALDKVFAIKKRQAQNKKGGIVGLMYVCAFIVEVGQSLVDPMGGGLPPFITIQV